MEAVIIKDNDMERVGPYCQTAINTMVIIVKGNAMVLDFMYLKTVLDIMVNIAVVSKYVLFPYNN